MSVSAYIDLRLFDPQSPPPRRRGISPVKDHQPLSRVMAMLGQSHFAANLNQLAKAANIGALVVTPEIEAKLNEAVRHIAAMRRMLVEALDLTDDLP